MKIDDIKASWREDSVIDPLSLQFQALKDGELHSKYYDIYLHESNVMFRYESEYNQLHKEKFDFYTQGPHEETPLEWKLPPIGRVIKSEVGRYLDADEDVTQMKLKVHMQREKIEFLKSILNMISRRSFQIKNAVEVMRIQSGA